MSMAHLDDELLSAHIDDALSAEESARVAAHLFACSVCSGRVDLLRATRRAVAALPLESPPRALDLGFTRAAAPRAGWLSRLLPRGTPAWAPPLASAAVVAALAVGLAPALLRSVPSATSRTATGISQAAGAAGNAASPPSGYLGNVPAAGSQREPVSPGAGGPEPLHGVADSAGGALTSRAFTEAGNATLVVAASPGQAAAGAPVQLSLRLVPGSSAIHLATTGMEIRVRRGTTESVVASSSQDGRVVAPGEQATVYASWAAGASGGAPEAGQVTVVGRVYLADGSVLELTLAFVAG